MYMSTLEFENQRLHALINRTAEEWLRINDIEWEGGVDAAMEAAALEIFRLREENKVLETELAMHDGAALLAAALREDNETSTM